MLKTIFGKPAKTYLEDHFADLNVVQSDRFLKLNQKVTFEDFNVEGLTTEDKFVLTKQLIDREGKERILVFCQKSEDSESLSRYLNDEGIPSEAFNAKQDDSQRADTIFKFHTSKVVCLVATDLASRGIDFKDVKLLIQFDYAENGVSLLHRIGRIGRMGTSGKGRLI